MKLKIIEFKGNVQKGAVKPYREEPSNPNKAAAAAFYYADRFDENMVVIPGNSHMNKVYHISRETGSVLGYTGINKQVGVFVVEPNGDVYSAHAIDDPKEFDN